MGSLGKIAKSISKTLYNKLLSALKGIITGPLFVLNKLRRDIFSTQVIIDSNIELISNRIENQIGILEFISGADKQSTFKIKKLNKNRIWTERPLGKWYFDKETTDYLRISIQLLDIKMELRDLKNRVWIHVLRLRFAIANTKSFELKTQLKFQEKIVLEHIANIKKLREENEDAWKKNYKSEYGQDSIWF